MRALASAIMSALMPEKSESTPNPGVRSQCVERGGGGSAIGVGGTSSEPRR